VLPDVALPASLAQLLASLAPCFSAPSFVTFCGLAAGLAGQVRRRTVAGMLLGAGLARCWPHDRAHYFFGGDPRDLFGSDFWPGHIDGHSWSLMPGDA
jgi:hypothetical protein